MIDDELTELSDAGIRCLPLAYQKILIKSMLPLHAENMLLLYNKKYRFKTGPRGSQKPISKILKE